MDCARVMRGISSMAKAATLAEAIAVERGVVAVGIHDGDDQRARLVGAELGRGRPADLEDDIRAADGGGGIGRDLRARGGVVRVRDARGEAGARLDGYLGAEGGEFLDGFRSGRDPWFIELRRYCDLDQGASPCFDGLGRRRSWPTAARPAAL